MEKKQKEHDFQLKICKTLQALYLMKRINLIENIKNNDQLNNL
jgi:hypothetical protein